MPSIRSFALPLILALGLTTGLAACDDGGDDVAEEADEAVEEMGDAAEEAADEVEESTDN
jgi:hypothetical protein